MYNRRNKEKKNRKVLAILLILAMAVSWLSGCGSSPGSSDKTEGQKNVEAEDDGQEKSSSQKDDAGESSEEPGKNKAMGRYVEAVSDLSDYCATPKGLAILADHTLVIPDARYQQVFSKDNGQSWDMDYADWFKELREEASYIAEISYGADGTVGVIYTIKKEENAAEGDTENEEGEDSGDSSDEGDYPDKNDTADRYRCLVVRPDGTQLQVQASFAEDELYYNGVWISDTGRVFVAGYGETLYEVDEEGNCKKFLTTEGYPELIQFQGNLMIVDSTRSEELLLYDMEKNEVVEDPVLQDFVIENYGDRDFSQQDCYDMYVFPGEEGVLYLAGNKGLHRHVIGGGAVEQVINGELSCLSSPSNGLMGMIALPENEFMALFYGNKVVRFTYDPDIPTVPDETLKVYSLKDNDTVRQAVSIYQAENPAVYVKYESGMGADGAGDGSVTRDDALKKLNTQIMAGEGPDVLILDDMPLDSYIEKNLLMDLGDCIGSFSGAQALFGNIVDAFQKDGKIYAVPCEFQIPVIEGKEEYISKMTDLAGIADVIEKLRAENPGEPVVDICSERGIMRLLSMVSAPAWKTDKGELDREALKEFLLQSKRVYDAQTEGLSGEIIENYMNQNVTYSSFYGGSRENSDYFRVADEIGYLMGDDKVMLGTVYYPHGVCEVFSVQKVEGYEEDVIEPMAGQCRNVFLPKTLVGVNAASEKTDRATEMVKVLLGRENQEYLFSGLPVNKAAFEKCFEPDESKMSEDGEFSSLGLSTGDGRSYTFHVYWIDDEQKQELMNWVEEADTPYIQDPVLEETVYTQGADYIRGVRSLDQAVDAIEQELAIYMSE